MWVAHVRVTHIFLFTKFLETEERSLTNLEMQNLNEYNWPERSLSYLCRSFDQLYRGQEYEEALPVIHIGFSDFTLHPEAPEFYATYKMLNVKNHLLYSDKGAKSLGQQRKIKHIGLIGSPVMTGGSFMQFL